MKNRDKEIHILLFVDTIGNPFEDTFQDALGKSKSTVTQMLENLRNQFRRKFSERKIRELTLTRRTNPIEEIYSMDYRGNVRICIVLEEESKNVISSPDWTLEAGASHIVETVISQRLGSGELSSSPNHFHARYSIDVSKLHILVEDIVLDISMANALLPQLKKHLVLPFVLSELKVEFATEQGLKSKYLKVSGNPKYCSLASFSRDENYQIDYDKYFSLWLEFSNGPMVSKILQYENDFTSDNVFRVADFEDFMGLIPSKFHGQISRKRLVETYQTLDKQKLYIYVRVIRKTKKKLDERRLEALLGANRGVGSERILAVNRLSYLYKIEHLVFRLIFKPT